MENFDLSTICDILILISAVIIAIKNIYSFIKKPADKVSEKIYSNQEQHMEEVIQAKIPEILCKHSENIKSERRAETQTLVNEMRDSITSLIDIKFKDLRELVVEQSNEIQGIKEALEKVKDSSKDILRIRMNEIYYKYLPYRKICNSDKQLFDNLYKDYHQLNGNSTWEKMNDTIQTWVVVDDNYEFDN